MKTQNKIMAEKIKEILKRSSDYHNVFTPFELCEKILEKIPSLNGNILVMFNLEFLHVIREKLTKEGLKNVWFLTPCEFKKRAAIITGIDENHIIIYEYNTKKIIGIENMPKFDVVVGNPPYVEPSKNRNGKSSMSPNKLWMKFMELALSTINDNGYLGYIIPSNWISPTNKLHKKLKVLNILDVNISRDIIKYFPGVGGSMNFSTIVLQKCQKQNIPLFTFDNNVQQYIDILSMKVVPMKSSNYLDFSILQKIEKVGNINGFKSMNLKREDYAINHKDNIYKVYIPMAKTPAHDVYLTNNNNINSCYVYIPKTIIEGENYAHNFNLPLYQKIRWEIRSGMAIISNIREVFVPTHKKMTSEEIYNYFKISIEEQHHINEYAKQLSNDKS